MRFAVIGPVPPFRSGVAKHTGEVAKALAAFGDVRTISFDRQYPKILFPGEDDRDPTTASDAPDGVEYVLDSMSPASWKHVANELSDWGPDIVVMPAWTFFTAPALTTIAVHLQKWNAKIVTVVHNAADHEAAPWKKMLLTRQIRASDAIITHTSALASAASRIAPGKPVAVMPHPLFEYPAANGALPRRAELELLMFGLVRPYKGADILVEAVGRFPGLDIFTSIVGESWGDRKSLNHRIAASPMEHRIERVDQYVSDQDAAEYFHRADVIVLPYRNVTGSGVVPLAMHYGKPVIATDLDGFRDMVLPGETGWLVPPRDIDALAICIAHRLRRNDAAPMRPAIRHYASEMTWDRFARQIIDVSGETNPALDVLLAQKTG